MNSPWGWFAMPPLDTFCYFCFRPFGTFANLREHFMVNHLDYNHYSRIFKNNFTGYAPLMCFHCVTIHNSLEQLHQHIEITHKRFYNELIGIVDESIVGEERRIMDMQRRLQIEQRFRVENMMRRY